MTFLEQARMAVRVVAALASGRRLPLVVSWNITRKCDLNCTYCGLHGAGEPEASTAEVLCLVESLARLGARFVGFSGGEPLTRPDFPRVVAACKDRGMRVSIQTNGLSLRKRIASLPGLDEVRVSLDGVREVQEALRGPRSHDAANDAIRVCRERGIPVLATAVMTGPSLARLPEFLDLAARLGVAVLFQPMDARFVGSRAVSETLWPDPEAFRAAVDLLIAHKERGSAVVANSLPGLRYLRGWPDPDPIPCRVSRLMCTVDADGRVFVCDMYPGYEHHLVRPDGDLGAVLRRLSLPGPCSRCITGAMADLNLAAAGRLDALQGVFTRWRRVVRPSPSPVSR